MSQIAAVPTEFVSPYSYLNHEWELQWERIASNKKYDRPNTRSEKEERALEVIANVGVIGGLQIRNLFGISKQQLKSMVKRHLLIRHSLLKNGKEIPIYTIGKYGANKIMPEYQENYWVEMDTLQVLKCISFFQFCYLFDEPEIIAAPEPFTAGIYLNNVPFYVYVAREGIKDLTMFLKWKKNFAGRIFIITEKIEFINGIEMFMETNDLKVRVILDKQLKQRVLKLYHYEPESPEKWIIG